MKKHNLSMHQIDEMNPIRRAIYESDSDASFVDKAKKVLEILTRENRGKPELIQHNLCQKGLNMMDPYTRAQYAPIKREGNIFDRAKQIFDEKLSERIQEKEWEEARRRPMSASDRAFLTGEIDTPNFGKAKQNFEEKLGQKELEENRARSKSVKGSDLTLDDRWI
jgi:hypothetical protein